MLDIRGNLLEEKNRGIKCNNYNLWKVDNFW